MPALIVKVRDNDRVLLGFVEPENITHEMITEAISQGAHCYLVGENSEKLRKTPIGTHVSFPYRWMFEEQQI